MITMKVESIVLYDVGIPFTFSIDHNLKKRKTSQSLVLAIYTVDGLVGYGECAPRPYVTGEEIDTVKEAFKSAFIDDIISEICSTDDIESLCTHIYKKFQLPSMLAALEMALLDLLAQSKNRSVSSFFQSVEYPVQYSAVLPYMSTPHLVKWLDKVKKIGFKHIKLKVGHPESEEQLALTRQTLGSLVDIRVDANRAWTLEEAIENINYLNKYQVSCVEEPLKNDSIKHLPELSRIMSQKLMLDESVYTLQHAKHYASLIEAKKLIFNIKLSKLGGLLRASALHRFAESMDIECQLGCNVGETAILSAAGRIFAQRHRLKYIEGSYAPYFMADDLTETPISFGTAGRADSMGEKGLGIKVEEKKLHQYSVASNTIYSHNKYCLARPPSLC